MTPQEILNAQSDEVVSVMFGHANSTAPLRDSEGNLREMTDDERAFQAACRAEFYARGLDRVQED